MNLTKEDVVLILEIMKKATIQGLIVDRFVLVRSKLLAMLKEQKETVPALAEAALPEKKDEDGAG